MSNKPLSECTDKELVQELGKRLQAYNPTLEVSAGVGDNSIYLSEGSERDDFYVEFDFNAEDKIYFARSCGV